MKKIVSFLLVMAMMILMVSVASAAEVVLRLADTQPETYPATAGCVKFAELVAEKSEGRIEIQVLSGGQLGGDEKAIIEQVQFGAIDFAHRGSRAIISTAGRMVAACRLQPSR